MSIVKEIVKCFLFGVITVGIIAAFVFTGLWLVDNHEKIATVLALITGCTVFGALMRLNSCPTGGR